MERIGYSSDAIEAQARGEKNRKWLAAAAIIGGFAAGNMDDLAGRGPEDGPDEMELVENGPEQQRKDFLDRSDALANIMATKSLASLRLQRLMENESRDAIHEKMAPTTIEGENMDVAEPLVALEEDLQADMPIPRGFVGIDDQVMLMAEDFVPPTYDSMLTLDDVASAENEESPWITA